MMEEREHVLKLSLNYTKAMDENLAKIDEMFQLIIDNYKGQNILPAIQKLQVMTKNMQELTTNLLHSFKNINNL